jgi:hypothetical protein
MPLTRFLGDTSFGPDEIAVLVSAYESAMRELNLPGPTAPGVETLAMTIIRFAKQGERDPVPEPPMKWAHHPNLRKRPRTPAKGRGSVQRAIKRAFAATSASALTSNADLRLGTRPPPAGPPQVNAVRCLFADAADAPGDV